MRIPACLKRSDKLSCHCSLCESSDLLQRRVLASYLNCFRRQRYEFSSVSGFVDQAVRYADAEIELAFSTLFGTFGVSFFKRYNEIRPIADGFFDLRLDIYNLWHLLTHVRLFGGSYVGSVDRILRRHGL